VEAPLLRWLVLTGTGLALSFGLPFLLASEPSKASSSSSAPLQLLPDLDQETPSQLQVQLGFEHGHRGYRLGFRSAVRNLGNGPLTVTGSRPDRSTPEMRVDQIVQRVDAPPRVIQDVGRMRYVVSPDHTHWHYLGFDRYSLQTYELHPAGASGALVEDQKTGFCLGDRYPVTSRPVAGRPQKPVFTRRCGLTQPRRLAMREGISVGYGDDYSAFLEGQDLPLDGLPDGRYVLVHRVNTDHGLRELTYANNAASVLLDLRWQDGQPSVRILARCPDTAECGRELDVRTVATGLETPRDLAFLPDGRALLTERPGRVRLLDPVHGVQGAPVATIDVSTTDEGGLLGLALDPEFAENRFVYLYYAGEEGMRLERWKWTGSSLVRETTLVTGIAAGEVHDSGHIDFGPDGLLYVATGDADQPKLAQEGKSLNGKFFVLTPYQYRSRTARPAIVAGGLRNPEGFDWQPGTGALVANDRGPGGFDEVNRILPGGNYGSPEVIGFETDGGRFTAPLRVYRNPIAPAGGVFITQPGLPWTGDYVLASLRGGSLHRLRLSNGRVVVDEELLSGEFGRLRTVREGPGGCLYVLTSNRDGRGARRPGDDRVLCVRLPGS
jgi:glucose/arabinose dehydrogenase